ncbi:MAG: DUF58 domain-containing protein [Cellvibrionaceae bacterium]
MFNLSRKNKTEAAKENGRSSFSFEALSAKGAFTDIKTLLQLRFIAKDLKLAPNKESRASLSGTARTRFRGRGMEFEEVRIYQAGDDIRTIDWRVTARTQTPHTKIFREEKERPTFLAVDQRSSLFFGSQRCFKSVLAAHVASIIGWASLENSDRVGGLIFGDSDHKDIRPRRSKHAVLELIHHLNEYNHALKNTINDKQQGNTEQQNDKKVTTLTILEDVRRLAKPGSAVFIIGDFHDYTPECDEVLYLLSRHCDITLIQIIDPLEQTLSALNNANGLLDVTDGEQRLQIAAYDKALQQKYRQRFETRQQSIIHQCQKLKINLFSFSTTDNEVDQMRKIFNPKSKHR